MKKINKDNYLNYKIPFNIKFYGLEPTIIFDKYNYIKTVLTFELSGKYIRNGIKDENPVKEKYESFLTIKREPKKKNLYFRKLFEDDLKNLYFPFSTIGNCKISLKIEKTQFDVEEEIPFEINIDNNLNSLTFSKIILVIKHGLNIKQK